MTEAVLGINQILLYRILSEAGTLAASKLAFQTEHEVTESKDMDSVATKDGNIGVPGQLETEISCTSILAVGDTMVKKLRDAMRNNELVEVWDIDKTAEPVASKYPATYYQGYITEYSKSAGAEDTVEISFSFAPNGVGVDGQATLTVEQAAVVQYVFSDTTIKAG